MSFFDLYFRLYNLWYDSEILIVASIRGVELSFHLWSWTFMIAFIRDLFTTRTKLADAFEGSIDANEKMLIFGVTICRKGVRHPVNKINIKR
jgi:hypothetical protein